MIEQKKIIFYVRDSVGTLNKHLVTEIWPLGSLNIPLNPRIFCGENSFHPFFETPMQNKEPSFHKKFTKISQKKFISFLKNFNKKNQKNREFHLKHVLIKHVKKIHFRRNHECCRK